LFSIHSSHPFLHVQTAYSHADYADLRRQKTGWGNGNRSAKADAAENADKDSYDIEGVYGVCILSALSARK